MVLSFAHDWERRNQNMKFKIESALLCALFVGVAMLGTACLIPSPAYAEDVIVICNEYVVVDTLNRNDVKKIYLGRKTRWDGGEKITFAALKGGQAHELFLKLYVGKTPFQFANHWKKKAFTGKGKVPKSFSTPEELIEYIDQTHGAIGYIPSSAYQNQIKSITIK
jgi:ABC-type phosphate transport system substrate-binding protein